MSILLRVIDGPQAGASCELREGQRVVLGRGETSDFHVLDSWASRAHCAVTYRPEGVILEDLKTKNGTYVGGKRVDTARLPDGALIQIGTTTVQVLLNPTRGTVIAMASPGRQRMLRAVLYVGAAGVLLLGAAFAAVLVLSRGNPKDGSGGFGVFGGPSRVSLAITSEPAGAMVFIDEEFCGPTPRENVELAAGDHKLRVQKAGYEVYRSPLKAARGSSQPIHVVLKLAERGVLMVRSKPEGASVYLDGDYRGNTPLRIEDLEPHTYSLRLGKANFADWHQEVIVKPTEVVPVDATLGRREIAYYEAELQKDPNNVSCHTEVAHLYLLPPDQKTEACLRHLAQAVEITVAERDTSQPDPYAARLVLMIQKIYFNDHFTYGDETFVQRMQGQIDTMLAELAAAHPESSFIHELAGGLCKRGGTSLLAKAAVFEAKANAQPTELAHYLNAVGFLILAGEHQRAEGLLQKACKANPDDPRPYLATGRFHLGSKRRGIAGGREKAIEALNAALQRAKSDDLRAEIRRLLGEATR
jgi:hypothetical protein